MKLRNRLFISVSAVLLTSIFIAYQFSENYIAQTRNDNAAIEVSPPNQEFELDPGETHVFEVRVSNRGSINLTVGARIEDFTATGDQGQVALIENGPWSVSQWTQFEPESFDLKPGQSQKVKVTIRVPSDNAAGGKYGAIVFGKKVNTEDNTTGLSQEVASLFLIRISGPVNENLQILDLDIPTFIESGPVPMELQLKNLGNIHVKATGLVNVTNLFGKKVADIVIPPTNVFPGSERSVEMSLNKKFLIGPYQTITILYYGADNKSLNLYTPFFVFPVKLVAALIVLFILVYFMRKRLSKATKALLGNR